MSKTAFIFPGQGAQAAGMGKDFYEAYPRAAEIYDMASDLLKLDMKALCFEENDKLDLTEYTQAALVTTCLAMEKVLEEAGVKPDITAGLSLGEYCAIHAAGGMSAADAHPHRPGERHPHAGYGSRRGGRHGGCAGHGSRSH